MILPGILDLSTCFLKCACARSRIIAEQFQLGPLGGLHRRAEGVRRRKPKIFHSFSCYMMAIASHIKRRDEYRRGGSGAIGPNVPSELRDELADVYRSFFGRIYGYCARRLYRSDLAEDAASACFLRFVEQYERIRGKSYIELRNWLYGLASNAVAKTLRDEKHMRLIQADVAQNLSVAMPPGDDMLDLPAVYLAMTRLRDDERETLILRFCEGLTTREIAEILGQGHSAVRMRLSRAVKKLRRNLGRSTDGRQETA